MATTLGVAVAARHVALVLVEQRRTGTVTLDQVVLHADPSATAPTDAAADQVLAEIDRIAAILDAHQRPLSRVAVAAVEPAAEFTAVDVVDTLAEDDLIDASLVASPSRARGLATTPAGNHDPRIKSALTAAHEIALDALALVPDSSGWALGGGLLRPALALAATALVTIGVGLIGFRALSDQSRPEPSPVGSTDPAPAQITQRTTPPPTATPAPAPAVSDELSPPALPSTIIPVPATIEQPEVPARPATTAIPAPTQEPPPSVVDTTPPPPQDGAPPVVPQDPQAPAAPPTPQAPAAPPSPSEQPLPGPVPPAPAGPQAGQTPP